MKKFHELEGFRGFFKGNGSNIIRIVPFSALEFYAFEKAKHRLLPQDNPRHKGWLLICGSISGIVASFCTYPLDLVRTILSINVDRAGSGIMKETVRIVNSEGVFGLYKGLNMTLFVISI
jgi:solute carrier family 25 phosphate transporter 23/24/25/41